MKFKHDKDRKQWAMITGPFASVENLLLREWVDILDKISILCGYGEIMITAYIKDGSHAEGTAVDIRIKDKGLGWYHRMVDICEAISLLNKRFLVNPHFEIFESQPHIHIRVLRK